MTTTVSARVVHLCPHVDEVDYGTVEMVFKGQAPELHGLRERLNAYATRKVTHEDMTQELFDSYDAMLERITSRWTTSGMEVVCTVEP